MIKNKTKIKTKNLIGPDVIMQVQREDLGKDGDQGEDRDAHHKEESFGLVVDCIGRARTGHE